MDGKKVALAAGLVAGGIAAVVGIAKRLEVDREKALARLEEGSLGSLVLAGAVTTDDARIWVRHPAEGTLTLALHAGDQRVTSTISPSWPDRADHTTSFLLSEAGLTLRPGSEVTLEITGADRARVGSCRFHTAPDDAGEDRFAFGVISCHDPFADNGSLHDAADTFVGGLVDACDAFKVKRVLFMGDQVYTDLPSTLSLFDAAFFALVAPQGREDILACNREEVRALVQQRYRQFWKEPAWQRLQASFASSTAPDDHEIVDNYGSTADHDTPAFRVLAAGALDAYHDYQARRTYVERRDCCDHGFRYGRVSTYLLDLRSERVTDAEETRIVSDAQLGRLQAFLDEASGQDVVVIGLSVPFLHVSESVIELAEVLSGDGGDFADRWNRGPSLASRDALLAVLHAHQVANPGTRMVVVGGDVHVGAFGRLVWDDGARPLLQLVTSPVSNEQPLLQSALAQNSPRQEARVGREGYQATAELLGPDEHTGANPYGGLNAGILEMRRNGDETQVRMRLLGMSGEGPETVCCTGWL